MRSLAARFMMAAGLLALALLAVKAEAKPAQKKKSYLERVSVESARPQALKAKTKAKPQAVKKQTAKKSAGISDSSKLSRDVVFDGSFVNGRYHSAGEAVAKVETEKEMVDLIGLRRDFKDRLSSERTRLKSGQ
jgi:hypothetical protein